MVLLGVVVHFVSSDLTDVGGIGIDFDLTSRISPSQRRLHYCCSIRGGVRVWQLLLRWRHSRRRRRGQGRGLKIAGLVSSMSPHLWCDWYEYPPSCSCCDNCFRVRVVREYQRDAFINRAGTKWFMIVTLPEIQRGKASKKYQGSVAIINNFGL